MTRSAAAQVGVLLLVCVCVYWVRLGDGGFHSTEGHRVIPAYEMLDHAEGVEEWLVPRMFDQPYLRKPPGMPWAVAISSSVLGESRFAARAVSAIAMTGMALLAFWAGWRWFGPRAGLPSGLAQALTPVLWESGRAAEIEALNNLMTQLACFGLIHCMVGAGSTPRGRWVSALLMGGLGIVGATLAKGPASAPVLIAVLAGVCLAARSLKPLRSPVWAALVIGLGGSAGLLGAIAWAAGRESLEPVTQSPSAFMFEPGQLLGIAALPFAAFVQFLPASIALVFPWGPDARAEQDRGLGEREWLTARTLAWAWVLAVGLFMVFGVRNPRYTLPAVGLCAPLVGYVVAGLGAWLTPRRDKISRVLLLGRPWVWVAVLVPAAWVYIGTIEASRRATSGEAVGRELAAEITAWRDAQGITGPVVLAADGLIEARPEVLLAAERGLSQIDGPAVDFRWDPGFTRVGGRVASGQVVLLALRTDEMGDERGVGSVGEGWFVRNLNGELTRDFDVHKFRFRLYLADR